MGNTEPDHYWERIKDIYKLLFGSLGLFVVSVGTFGEGGISTLFALLFFIALTGGSVAFVYYAYKDKRELATRYSGVSTRHWATIVVLMWLTTGLYALVYTLARYVRYDTADSGRGSSSSGLSTTETIWAAVETFGDSAKSSYRDSAAARSESTDASSGLASGAGGSTTSTTASSTTSGGARHSGDRSSGDGRSSSTSSSASSQAPETNVFTLGDDATSDTNVYERERSGGAQFCTNCGTEFSAHGTPSACPDCGAEVD